MSGTFVPYYFSTAVISGQTEKAREMLVTYKDAIQNDPMLASHVLGTIDRNAAHHLRAGLIQAAREAGLSSDKKNVRPADSRRPTVASGLAPRVR